MLKLLTLMVAHTQVIYEKSLQKKVSPTLSVLPLEGWTSCLQQLPPFNFGCLYAHISTDSKTIAVIQRITAVDGYYMFRDDHVQVVGF